KGFRDARELYETRLSVDDPAVDAVTSFDPETRSYHLWLVQRGASDYRLEIDLSRLGVAPGSPVVAEAVGPASHGEVTGVTEVGAGGKFVLTLPAQTVALLTIPSAPGARWAEVAPSADATVAGGRHRERVEGDRPGLEVALDAANPDRNRVAYVYFDLDDASRA